VSGGTRTMLAHARQAINSTHNIQVTMGCFCCKLNGCAVNSARHGHSCRTHARSAFRAPALSAKCAFAHHPA
jgi:hypothetical protein